MSILTNEQHRESATIAPRRRWPLLAIGASAGTATWSGWVGLGQLTGFGVVHPLPGIADGFTINTAVTLPIGVEAYAMYALSIATSARPLPDRTRRYAWASSAAALLLGMAGQVAYHVMTAHRPDAGSLDVVRLAPSWVIALVSCLPVLVLGAASLLWHLAGSADPGHQRSAIGSGSAPAPDPVSQPDVVGKPAIDPRSESVPAESGPANATSGSDRTRIEARPGDLARVREAIAAGDLPATPTASAIRTLLAISPAYARAARDALTPDPGLAALTSEDTQPPEPEHISSPPPAPQQPTQPAAEETPEQAFQQHISAVTKKSEPRTQPITTEEPIEKDEEVHTYAVGLP